MLLNLFKMYMIWFWYTYVMTITYTKVLHQNISKPFCSVVLRQEHQVFLCSSLNTTNDWCFRPWFCTVKATQHNKHYAIWPDILMLKTYKMYASWWRVEWYDFPHNSPCYARISPTTQKHCTRWMSQFRPINGRPTGSKSCWNAEEGKDLLINHFRQFYTNIVALGF